MANQERDNLILGIIILILIAGGVYYYKNKRTLAPEGPVAEENGTPVNGDSEGTEGVITSTEPQSGGKIFNKNPAIETQQKFDVAMQNAGKAFGSGDYSASLKYYQEALGYVRVDTVYSGMFNVYTAQKDWVKARSAIDSALALNSKNADYWISKLYLLDEQTEAIFAELKAIYQDGLAKVDSRIKINLVTQFAVIAENNKEYQEAIALWEQAKPINPEKSAVYQGEIDRLQAL